MKVAAFPMTQRSLVAALPLEQRAGHSARIPLALHLRRFEDMRSGFPDALAVLIEARICPAKWATLHFAHHSILSVLAASWAVCSMAFGAVRAMRIRARQRGFIVSRSH